MNGRTNGQKTGSLYRAMPEAGASKSMVLNSRVNARVFTNVDRQKYVWTYTQKTGSLYLAMSEAGAIKKFSEVSHGFSVTDLNRRVDARVVANVDGWMY